MVVILPTPTLCIKLTVRVFDCQNHLTLSIYLTSLIHVGWTLQIWSLTEDGVSKEESGIVSLCRFCFAEWEEWEAGQAKRGRKRRTQRILSGLCLASLPYLHTSICRPSTLSYGCFCITCQPLTTYILSYAHTLFIGCLSLRRLRSGSRHYSEYINMACYINTWMCLLVTYVV